MWKKAVGFVILLVALLCSFFACASGTPKIPSEDAFSAHLEVTSVTALETGEYRIAVQTTLKTHRKIHISYSGIQPVGMNCL